MDAAAIITNAVLQKRLARFFQTQDAIIYSYDIATPASVIPTLVNRKDVVVVDEVCA